MNTASVLKLETAACLVALLAIVGSAGAAAAPDVQKIEETILANRARLHNVCLTIDAFRMAEGRLIRVACDRWAISPPRFFHEYEFCAEGLDANVPERIHEARLAYGGGEVYCDYVKKFARSMSAFREPDDSPVNSPWRLTGESGAGLGDALSWIREQGVSLSATPAGLIEAAMPEKTDAVLNGQRIEVYRKRVLMIDVERGGLVVSVCDYAADGKLILKLENSDIGRSSQGAWYPRKTTLTRYADGQVARMTERRVTLADIGEYEAPSLFSINVPKGFRVADHLADIDWSMGDDGPDLENEDPNAWTD